MAWSQDRPTMDASTVMIMELSRVTHRSWLIVMAHGHVIVCCSTPTPVLIWSWLIGEESVALVVGSSNDG